MYKFPFAIELRQGHSGPVFGFDFTHPNGHVHFETDGHDHDDNPSPGLTSSDARYLDRLNALVAEAAQSAFMSIEHAVLHSLGAAQSDSPYFDEPEKRLAMRQFAADCIVLVLQDQATSGLAQMAEVTGIYSRYLSMTPAQQTALQAPYQHLAPDELEMLAEHAHESVCKRLPDYGVAFEKLGWSGHFIANLNRAGKLMPFYAMLKELKQTYRV